MKKLRRLTAVILSLLLVFSLSALAAPADRAFPDVATGAWYEDATALVYELGLMKGDAKGNFNPGGTVTLAELSAMAARICNNLYFDDAATFNQGSPWYKVYVDYCHDNLLLDYYSDYTMPATRAQFADALFYATPYANMEIINYVDSIPDMSGLEEEAYGIETLYGAGILSGSDGGKFRPGDTITRAECAAIIARIYDPSLRKSFSIVDGVYSETSGSTYTPPPVATQPEPEPEPQIAEHETETLKEALARGAVSVELYCDAIDYASISIENRTGENLSLIIGGGLYLAAGSSSDQNLLVTSYEVAYIPAYGEDTVSVDTCCMNMHRDIPEGGASYSLSALSESSKLLSLLETLYDGLYGYAVRQAAVWIITDQASYSDCRDTLRYGDDTSVISQEDYDTAKALVNGL